MFYKYFIYTILLITITFMFSSNNTNMLNETNVSTVSFVNENNTVQEVVLQGRTTLNHMIDETLLKLNSSENNSVHTTEVDGLKTVIEADLNILQEPLPYEVLTFFGVSVLNVADFDAHISQIVEERVQDLTTNVALWESAVKAEKNKQVELYQRAVETVQKRGGSLTGSVQANGELASERIERLMKDLPFTIPVIFGSCDKVPNPSITLACYTEGDSAIKFTDFGLSKSDCYVQSTIAHEYRHYEQFITGVMAGSSVEWLEADARDFQKDYGCAP